MYTAIKISSFPGRFFPLVKAFFVFGLEDLLTKWTKFDEEREGLNEYLTPDTNDPFGPRTRLISLNLKFHFTRKPAPSCTFRFVNPDPFRIQASRLIKNTPVRFTFVAFLVEFG